ncbi:MAG: tryptophan synthase subunit alpha [Bacteroidales bacterium]|nr:tryptophan synthase subunit alpha [Bacteroidales bacterium]
MKNRIDEMFEKKQNLLSIYFTAGFPKLEDTMPVLRGLEKSGVDFVEIGMPFSDPLADGPVIQLASIDALNNGMCIKKLMEQIKEMRKEITMPVILMGYINPVMHYGIEKFAQDAESAGVDGVILPDLPFDEYVEKYKEMFDSHKLHFIPLIAPQSPDERIRHIDSLAEGFIYTVASAGITGNIKTSVDYRTAYFERIRNLKLRNKAVIGFGIKDNASYKHACEHADGAIIGTAFVNYVKENGTSEEAIKKFVGSIR